MSDAASWPEIPPELLACDSDDEGRAKSTESAHAGGGDTADELDGPGLPEDELVATDHEEEGESASPVSDTALSDPDTWTGRLRGRMLP